MQIGLSLCLYTEIKQISLFHYKKDKAKLKNIYDLNYTVMRVSNITAYLCTLECKQHISVQVTKTLNLNIGYPNSVWNYASYFLLFNRNVTIFL